MSSSPPARRSRTHRYVRGAPRPLSRSVVAVVRVLLLGAPLAAAAVSPPFVVSSAPGVVGDAARNQTIRLVFSEPMDAASVLSAFVVSATAQGATAPSPRGGSQTWDATGTTMTWVPAPQLEYGDAITWAITTAARSRNQKSLANAVSGGFHVRKLRVEVLPPMPDWSGGGASSAHLLESGVFPEGPPPAACGGYDATLAGAGRRPLVVGSQRVDVPLVPGNPATEYQQYECWQKAYLTFDLGALAPAPLRIPRARLLLCMQGRPALSLGSLLLHAVRFAAPDVRLALTAPDDVRLCAIQLASFPGRCPPLITITRTPTTNAPPATSAIDISATVAAQWQDRAARLGRSQFLVAFEHNAYSFEQDATNLLELARGCRGVAPAALEVTYEHAW